jgi:hypothetical protein
MRKFSWTIFLTSILALSIDTLSFGQGLQSTPYAPAPFLRRESLDLAPFSPSGPLSPQSSLVTKSDSFLSQDSWKKDIPNLQMGYEFYSGKNWRVGYFTLDYLLPIRMTESSIFFGEAHSELQGSSTNLTTKADEQVFLSFGGGYRAVLKGKTLLGVNCFYDTARFANRWVSSGGAGLETAFLLHGYDALDMKLNWYGDLSEGDLINQYRDGPGNFDLQFGYSHQLFQRGPDLRLSCTVYDFDDESGVLGWQAGGELKSPNGVASIKGETGHDPVNGSYQSLSAFINIGFQVENLTQGKNPFVMPEPIFSSPRNMNRLTQKVTRNYRHTTYGLQATLPPDPSRIVTIVNNTGDSQKVYVVFSKTWMGAYSLDDFVKDGWNKQDENSENPKLYASIDNNHSLPLNFSKPNGGKVSFSTYFVNKDPGQKMGYTQAEFTIQDHWSFDDSWHAGYDISLLDGFNYPVKITAPYSQSQDLNENGNFYSPNISVKAATGNSGNYGVFGLGSDMCCSSCKVPTPTCDYWGAGQIKNEIHPAKDSVVKCPAGTCTSCSSHTCGGSQCDPKIKCQVNVWDKFATGKEYTVTFGQ